jgi:hypothetical protein
MIEVIIKLKKKIMLKKILNLKGAQEISRSEQKNINGGGPGNHQICCNPASACCVVNPKYPQYSSCQFIAATIAQGCI